MNHVNAIRCNDEYQCSHCGKSWDIHEEAPDCKMTVVETFIQTKKVNYFGFSFSVSEKVCYIATDETGHVYGYTSEPESSAGFWYTSTGYIEHICKVNLHGLDWRETLRKC